MPDLAAFHEQVKRGDLDGVKAALQESPALLNERNSAGQTAFLLACYYGQKPVAEHLLSLHPELDTFSAAVAGLDGRVLEAVQRDPNALTAYSSDGWTVLHLAAFFGHTSLVNALLDAGAAVDVRSTNAMINTPLHAAVAGGKKDAAGALLARGADLNACQHGGWSPLHGAAQAGNRELVELLLANGAHVNARADNNQSPLDLALSKGHTEVAALLEELGAKLQ